MSEVKRWIVTISGETPVGKIGRDLTEIGFEIEQILDEIGCIIGSASDEIAENARNIAGVSDVSPDEPIDIGPPDAPVTW